MRTVVVIEARHLDTDARERVSVEVDPQLEAHAQRTQLAGLVAERRPNARLRSFGDGAATFLDRDHLVVAAYSPRPSPSGRRPEADTPQDALFAA